MWVAVQQCGNRLHGWIIDGDTLQEVQVAYPDGDMSVEGLLSMIDPYLPADGMTPVICAGLDTGSFAQVPCAVPPLQKAASGVSRIALHVLPCLSQATPVDAMQGEEATIAGFLATYPDWDGILCLPGSCTRWVHVSAGEAVSFRSYLTGELFDLLAGRSSLSRAVAGQGWDAAVFDDALSDAMSRPERLASALAGVQAAARLRQGRLETARAQVLGALIGVELAAARPYWLGQNVAVIGAQPMTGHYAAALAAQGVMAQVYEDGPLALEGLREAYRALTV